MNWKLFLILFGIAIAVLLGLALLIFITILCFIKYKKNKNANHAEAKFVSISFIIVLVIHFVCVSVINSFEEPSNMDFIGFISEGLEEIFRSLGGLTFEGQEFLYSNLCGCICSIIYFASIAWLAITNGILIVLGISHTIYSEVRKKFFIRKDKNIYIFLYATKESLILANNIMQEAETNLKKASDSGIKKEIKGREKDISKIKIIFSSDELEPFDKNNEIHNEIAERDYFYIPFPKKDIKRRKSIIENLFHKKVTKLISNNNIKIFALKTDKYQEGFEAKNNDIVFDDVKLLLEKAKKEIAKKFKVKTNEVTYENFLAQCETTINKNDGRYKYEQNKKNLLINYYLLSNNEPNYEFYSFKLKDIFRTIFNYNDEQWKDQNVPLFNLTILNEALMSAENLIDERHEKLDEDSPITKHSQDKVYINYLEDGQKALVIGFGQNGQKALEHVYLDSNGGEMEKDMFIPTKFNAEILDPNIDKIITSYIATHPSFVFNEGAIRNIDYNEKCFDKLKERYDVVNFKELDKYMAFPRVFYKNSNYNEPAFIDTLDDICKRKYNVIIIALGDDEETIKCANTIIQSLRQSIKLLRNYDNKNLKIFINIKDHNNNDRLQWYDGDKKIMENVFIYKFGNLSKIYSTDLFEIKNAIKAYKYYKEIGEGINIDKTKKEINWEYDYIRNSSMYEKKTNESVYKFGEIYKKYLYEISDCTKAKNFYDLIKRDYQGYLECITDNSKVKKFKDIDKPYFDTEILCVVENIDSKIIENFKAIYETTNTIEGCRIKMNFANYKRLLDDNIFDDLNNIWRYLVQFEHSRWCRHMMIYGRAYTKEYKKEIFDDINHHNPTKNDEIKDFKNKSYWKNNLKLHTCLLPYSKTPDYKTKGNIVESKYLPYSYEDFDYGCIAVALNLDD